MENENSPSHVAFHFDVMCPWAYQTSIWMREVRDRLNIEVDWCFFSLEKLIAKKVKNTHGSVNGLMGGQ